MPSENLTLGVPIIGRKGLNFARNEKKLVKLSPFPKTTPGLTIKDVGKISLILFSPKNFESA